MRKLAATLLIGALAALALGAGLAQLTWNGWSHSFDSAIYVRSLWGLAFGHSFNPMVELHAMSVHFSLVMWPLVPLARVIDPAVLLVVLQALAWGATVALVGTEMRRSIDPGSRDVWGGTAAAAAGTVLMVMTPLVANPFLFDLRPDLVAVPLATAGFIRARRQGDWDARAVALLLSSLLAREEMMLTVVAALLTTPWGRGIRDRWRLRLVGIAIAVGWWSFYWFGVRRWIGDGSYDRAHDVAGEFLDASLTPWQVAGYKLEILAAFAMSMGGLSLLGWRWLGAALPGLAILLVMQRLQPLVLNFHYALFAAPAIIAAGLDGFDRLNRRFSAQLSLPLLVIAIGAASFSLSSAMPGGARFREENFAMLVDDDSDGLAPSDVEQLHAMHALVAQIPPDAGAAVPYPLAPAIAGREVIVATERLEERGIDGYIDTLDCVGLPGRAWPTLGAQLVESHGFRLVGNVERRLALLCRSTDVVSPLVARPIVGEYDCAEVTQRWPSAGVANCGLQRLGDGRVAVLLQRETAIARPVHVAVRVGESAVPTVIGEGLLRVDHLAVGMPFVAFSVAPLPPGEVEIGVFVDGDVVAPSGP
jgi:uncharacterized membrane protein